MRKFFLSVLILCSSSFAADIIDIFGDQSSFSTGFGADVDASHDMNRDGVNDFVYPYQNGASSEIRIRSGSDGSMLDQIPISVSYRSFALGDMNGDTYPDIAIGAPDYDSNSEYSVGLVYVISGSDLSILFQKEGAVEFGGFGASLAFNDFDGDGRSELLVISGGSEATERFELINSNGSRRCGGNLPSQFSDRDVTSAIGSVNPNQDGIIDFALSAPVFGIDGAVLFFNGSTCDFITAILGGPGTSEFGDFMLPAGDFDGDLVNDFAVYSSSRVYILKGRGLGSVALAPSESYTRTQPVGDLNGDGTPDFVLKSESSFSDEEIRVISGKDGQVIGVINEKEIDKALKAVLGSSINTSGSHVEPIQVGHRFNLDGDGVTDFSLLIRDVIAGNTATDYIASFSGQCLRQVVMNLFPGNGMILRAGDNHVTATPEVCGVKLSSSLSVTGANQSVSLKDDGTAGDITPNDGTYSGVVRVPVGTTSFSVQGTVGAFSAFEAFNVTTATPYLFRSSSYEWIEGGTDINGASQIVERTLPFAFSFYGRSRNKVFVSPVGLLGFTAGSIESKNEPIPSKKLLTDFIAPLWADLVPTSAARVLVNTIGTPGSRRFVVSWENFEFRPTVQNEVSQVTFQAVLSEGSNLIKFNFKRVYSSVATKDKGASSISGIQASAVFGTMYSNREQKLTDLSAVEFLLDGSNPGNGGGSGGGNNLSLQPPTSITARVRKGVLSASLPRIDDGRQYVFEYKLVRAGKKSGRTVTRTLAKPTFSLRKLKAGDRVEIRGAYIKGSEISGFTKLRKIRVRS